MPRSDEPSRRAAADVVRGCAELARLLAVGPAATSGTQAAVELLARRGVPAVSGTAARYAAVQTTSDRQARCVVGVFTSSDEAAAYADAAGWPDFQVAVYRFRPPWGDPGQR